MLTISEAFCLSGVSRHRITLEMPTLQGHPQAQLSPAQQAGTDAIGFSAPIGFHPFGLPANPRPHPRFYESAHIMIAKKYSLPKGGGTKLNKQISRVKRCNPWLQNKAIPPLSS